MLLLYPIPFTLYYTIPCWASMVQHGITIPYTYYTLLFLLFVWLCTECWNELPILRSIMYSESESTLYYAIPCWTSMVWHVIATVYRFKLYYTLLHYNLMCKRVQHVIAILYPATSYYTIPRCPSKVLHVITTLCPIILYYTVPCWESRVQHVITILYPITLYYTLLHCTLTLYPAGQVWYNMLLLPYTP